MRDVLIVPYASHRRTAETLRRGVVHMARQLRRLRADHGVSHAKLSVLSRLHRAEGPLTAVALARLERLQPQSLTRILAELHERGLLTRRPGETDRREVLFEITPAGRALLIQDAKQQTIWLAAALEAGFTETEASLLALAAPLLERLAAMPVAPVAPD